VVEDLEREVEIELAGAGEDVRDPILTEAGEMGVPHLVGQDGNNRIAADIGASPSDFAVRIEHNAVSGRAAPGEPVLSRVMLVGVVWVRIQFGVSLGADAPDKPGIDPRRSCNGSKKRRRSASSGRHRPISVRPSMLVAMWQIT
jgi:hypothetical protein